MRFRRASATGPTRAASWVRALNVVFRTAHLLSVGVVLGGIIFTVDPRRLAPFIVAAAASGLALGTAELAADSRWPLTVKGAVVLAKLPFLATLLLIPGGRVPILVLTFVAASIAAHMPSRLRHRQLWRTFRRTKPSGAQATSHDAAAWEPASPRDTAGAPERDAACT